MSRPVTLAEAYAGLGAVLDGCDAADLGRPTRAAGWTVRDLLFHLLLDAQRALVALATPASTPPDRDRFDYWHDVRPDPTAEPGQDRHAAFVRRAAAAYGDRALLALWRDTATAAAHAVDTAERDDLVETQGHVLTVVDLASTLVVEACVHHLDLVVDLASAPGPGPRALAETRTVLDTLLGGGFPADWSDERVALVATGRETPDATELAALGDAAARLPLLG